MLEREIKIDSLYKHFKGHIYKIICIAKDSETLEEMVVYSNVDTGDSWVRNKDMFLSEVDHNKYPDIKQKYRFEEIGKS